MDKTLRDYLTLSDTTHENLEKNAILYSNKHIEDKILSLHSGIKNLQVVAKRLADIANMANQYLLSKGKKIPENKTINTYPNGNDHATLRMLYPTHNEQTKIIDDVVIPVKHVKDIAEIPISKLYYVTSIKQYAINIEGLIIKGNLGNVLNYKGENTACCEYGISCKNLSTGKHCKYYHEPEDYIKLSREPPDTVRNFTVGSWLYSKNHTPRSYFTRHIGSYDSLKEDLQMLKKIQYKEEVYNREGQLIHDLLIYYILHNQGFLDKYQHWQQ